MASPERQYVPRQHRIPLSFENRILLLALAAGAIPSAIAFVVLWSGNFSPGLRWSLAVLTVLFWVGFALETRISVVRPMRTLANMQAAVREGDFSIRARTTGVNDSLSDVLFEINELASTLQNQRVGAFEAGALMRKVLAEVDIAVFAFDDKRRLRLLNRAAERLIGQVSERAIGLDVNKLGIEDLLEGDLAHTIERSFPGGTGRFSIRRSGFRQGGVPHQLVVVTDLSRALREEERQAWQRLVRVLGHELNNSLAPIKSISQSLQSLFRREPRPGDWEEDVSRGLQIISDRAEALTRFVADYARLARLPKPNIRTVPLAPILRRIAALDTRLPVHVENGPDVVIDADPDQLEQLFINLLKNAIDASVESGGRVCLGWSAHYGTVQVRIVDEGPGLANTANLFVPFFTTKQGGSGIGLALSRQITEAHNGRISLANREDTKGCEAVVELPLKSTLQ